MYHYKVYQDSPEATDWMCDLYHTEKFSEEAFNLMCDNAFKHGYASNKKKHKYVGLSGIDSDEVLRYLTEDHGFTTENDHEYVTCYTLNPWYTEGMSAGMRYFVENIEKEAEEEMKKEYVKRHPEKEV